MGLFNQVSSLKQCNQPKSGHQRRSSFHEKSRCYTVESANYFKYRRGGPFETILTPNRPTEIRHGTKNVWAPNLCKDPGPRQRHKPMISICSDSMFVVMWLVTFMMMTHFIHTCKLEMYISSIEMILSKSNVINIWTRKQERTNTLSLFHSIFVQDS